MSVTPARGPEPLRSNADLLAALRIARRVPAEETIVVPEPLKRRPGFIEGRAVRLSDGQEWWLPFRDPARDDLEYDALLAVICEAEDRVEGLLAELALTIFLLTRNYELAPNQLERLLQFRADDPSLRRLQAAVHEVVVESLRRLHPEEAVKNSGEMPTWGNGGSFVPHKTWSLRGLLGLR
jgi:hypothetical protein